MFGQLAALILTQFLPSAIPDHRTKSDIDMTLAVSSGGRVAPLKVRGKPRVLLFVLSDCPIANQYAPEIGRLIGEYSARIDWFIIDVDQRLSISDAARHAKAFGIRCPTLLDPRRQVSRKLGVNVSPEACLLDRGGKLRYRGRIDNLFPSLGVRRESAATHDLRDAISEVLAGKPVKEPRTEAIGCVLSLK